MALFNQELNCWKKTHSVVKTSFNWNDIFQCLLTKQNKKNISLWYLFCKFKKNCVELQTDVQFVRGYVIQTSIDANYVGWLWNTPYYIKNAQLLCVFKAALPCVH